MWIFPSMYEGGYSYNRHKNLPYSLQEYPELLYSNTEKTVIFSDGCILDENLSML